MNEVVNSLLWVIINYNKFSGGSPSSRIKYYEPEKSCYVNGTFFSQCKIYLDQIEKSKNER
jgi:hypothetical protein